MQHKRCFVVFFIRHLVTLLFDHAYYSIFLVYNMFLFWIYRFINNVLSTAQQVWLRKLGGAKPVVNENASGIITAGQAKRSASQPERTGERLVSYILQLIFVFGMLQVVKW